MSWLGQSSRSQDSAALKNCSESIREHLDRERFEELMEDGMSRVQAAQAARRAFGNVTLTEERSREVWQWPTAESIAADLRFALRQLCKSPGFTTTAVLTLALGIGANTAVFSVVDAVLLKPLPYRNADRLVMIAQELPKETVPAFDTYREYEVWNRYSKSFEKLAAATWAGRLQTILSWHGEKQEILAVPVSVDFFSMLGVPTAQGRTFETQDLNAPCTVVLAQRLLEGNKRLGGAPSWIGKSLTLDNRDCTILGVMPKNFSFYPKQTELWTLITPSGKLAQKPWDMPVLAFGLLKPGVDRPAAQADCQYPEPHYQRESRLGGNEGRARS